MGNPKHDGSSHMFPCEHCQVRGHTMCAALHGDHLAALEKMRVGNRTVPAGTDLFRQGEINKEVFTLLEGWVMLYTLLEDGRRQINEFCLPGAAFGFEVERDSPAPYTAQAVTDVRLCVLPGPSLVEFLKQEPVMLLELARTCGRSRILDFQHLMNLGRRTARERVASLLLELFVRVRMRSPDVHGDTINLPLTQEHIGDALGLTNIHVNRVLRGLREDEIVTLKSHRLEILDPDKLAEEAGFDSEVYVPYLTHQ